jgi:hypothetical protein
MTAFSLAFAASSCASASRMQAVERTPASGAQVLESMRAAYFGKWYHTLRFEQKTTIRRPNGTDTVQTWYESLQHTPESGTRLRIDIGNPELGNGVLYTADSTYVFRAGKLTATRAGGNEFLPLIEGVYVQPVERTMKELEATKVDMSRVTTGEWGGKKVWIVGATSPTDTLSPQFWVDADRKVIVRMLLQPAPTAPTMDIHLGDYVALSSGWLATKVDMYVSGARRQTEEYSDWQASIPLDPGLFDAATWSTARHWQNAKR